MGKQEDYEQFSKIVKSLLAYDGLEEYYDRHRVNNILVYSPENKSYAPATPPDIKTYNEERKAEWTLMKLFAEAGKGYVVVPSAAGPQAVSVGADGKTVVKSADEKMRELPVPPGNAFTRWFKKTVHSIVPSLFKEQAELEASYAAQMSKLNEVKSSFIYDIHPVEMVRTTLYRKEDQLKAEVKSLEKGIDSIAAAHGTSNVTHKLGNVKEEKYLWGAFTKDLAVKVLTSGNNELIDEFLMGPKYYSRETCKMIESYRTDFMKNTSTYTFTDSKLAVKALNTLASKMVKEPELGRKHNTAALYGNMLASMAEVNRSSLNANEKNILDAVPAALDTLSEVYNKGIKSELSVLINFSKGNSKLGKDDFEFLKANVLARDAVNSMLAKNKKLIDGKVSRNRVLELMTDPTFTAANIINSVQNSEQFKNMGTVKSLEAHLAMETNKRAAKMDTMVDESLNAFRDFYSARAQADTKKLIEKSENAEKEAAAQREKDKTGVVVYKPKGKQLF